MLKVTAAIFLFHVVTKMAFMDHDSNRDRLNVSDTLKMSEQANDVVANSYSCCARPEPRISQARTSVLLELAIQFRYHPKEMVSWPVDAPGNQMRHHGCKCITDKRYHLDDIFVMTLRAVLYQRLGPVNV